MSVQHMNLEWNLQKCVLQQIYSWKILQNYLISLKNLIKPSPCNKIHILNFSNFLPSLLVVCANLDAILGS